MAVLAKNDKANGAFLTVTGLGLLPSIYLYYTHAPYMLYYLLLCIALYLPST